MAHHCLAREIKSTTMLFDLSKTTIGTLSNIPVLAVVLLPVVANWDQAMFVDFVNNRLSNCWPLLLSVMLNLITPMIAKPKEEKSPASTPTVLEARRMAFFTAAIDYLVFGGLFLFWNSILGGSKDGSTICPFSAASTFWILVVALKFKDDVQCRLIWRKFTSRTKLNTWPFSWELALEKNLWHIPFHSLIVMGLVMLGLAEFPSIFSSPFALARIWLETMAAILLIDKVSNKFLHKFMHEKAYFLHKNHHKGKCDINMEIGSAIDLLDIAAEFGGAVPLLLGAKWLLGLTPKVHLLTHFMVVISAFETHSMNPYAVFFFNPILDYFMRPTLCHNLHHAVQKNYYTVVPISHLFSPGSRCKDIDLYNKYMKTSFPREV